MMRHKTSLVLLCLVVTSSWPVPALAEPTAAKTDSAESLTTPSVFDRARDLVTMTEDALKAGDAANASAYLRGLRAILRVAPEGRLPAGLAERAVRLRAEVARAGGVIEDWEMWAYDGRDPGDHVHLVREIERAIDQYRRLVAAQDVLGSHRALVNLKSRLGFTVFEQEPVLGYFRAEVAGPAIAGISRFHGEQIVARIADYLRLAERAFARKEMDKAIAHVRMAQNYYSLLAGGDLQHAAYSVTLAAGRFGLREALVRADAMVRQSEAYLAKARADEAERDALWRSLLAGDKARLYSDFGPPSMWDVTENEWSPEDAAKALWWRYFESIDAHNKRQITYTFDRDDTIVHIDKTDVYIPF